MYRSKFNKGTCEFVLEDVFKVEGKGILDIELATASVPCNDLSLAGALHGFAGTHSSAFWVFMDAIKGMGKPRPPLNLRPNVAAFLI